MSETYRNLWGKFALPGSNKLRQRMAQAMADYLEKTPATTIAQQLGHAGSTITRRAPELRCWPADEFLFLAQADRSLGEAVCDYLSGQEAPDGHGMAVTSDLSAEIVNSGKVNVKIGEAIADGKVSVAEARGILAELAERRRHEDDKLIPDLMAVIRNIA